MPSEVSALLTVSVTAALGLLLSLTVKLALVPVSDVVTAAVFKFSSAVSLSRIVAVPVLTVMASAELVESLMALSLTVKVSVFSSCASSFRTMLIVLVVSPGANCNVPDSALKSVPELAVLAFVV